MSDKSKKFASQCLLLKTPEGCFFTEEDHFPLLIEFGKTFGAEISVVKTVEPVEVQDMDSLAKSICEGLANKAKYEVIETKLAVPLNKPDIDRSKKLKNGREVADYVKEMLAGGGTISVPDLENKFPHFTKQYLTSNFTRARREMRAQGETVVKEKPGVYRLHIMPA